MGVRAIVVYTKEKKTAQWQSFFTSETKGCFPFMCVVDAAQLFKANAPVLTLQLPSPQKDAAFLPW